MNVVIAAGPEALVCWSAKPSHIGESGWTKFLNGRLFWLATDRGSPRCTNMVREDVVWKRPLNAGEVTAFPFSVLLLLNSQASAFEILPEFSLRAVSNTSLFSITTGTLNRFLVMFGALDRTSVGLAIASSSTDRVLSLLSRGTAAFTRAAGSRRKYGRPYAMNVIRPLGENAKLFSRVFRALASVTWSALLGVRLNLSVTNWVNTGGSWTVMPLTVVGAAMNRPMSCWISGRFGVIESGVPSAPARAGLKASFPTSSRVPTPAARPAAPCSAVLRLNGGTAMRG